MKKRNNNTNNTNKSTNNSWLCTSDTNKKLISPESMFTQGQADSELYFNDGIGFWIV